jgi:anti-anti-sigma factor
MCVQVSRAQDAVIIRVTGTLDQAAAILLRRALFDLIVDQANVQLVLDLCDVTEMSEAALQTVEDAKEWTRQSNSHLGICT